MNPVTNAIVLVSLLVPLGCGLYLAKEPCYLPSATHRATQDQIRQQLGPPLMVSTDNELNASHTGPSTQRSRYGPLPFYGDSITISERLIPS